MEKYENLLKKVKLLPIEEQKKISSELQNILQEKTNLTLDQLLPISDNMLAVPGHTLSMKVERRLIYNHLSRFKKHLLKVHSENMKLKDALSDTSGFLKRIKQIKLSAPEIIVEEQAKDIKNRTILTGVQKGNPGGCTFKTGVKNIIYLRNKDLTENIPLNDLIEEIISYGLNEEDALKLLFVILGLPKAGYQDPDGRWCDIGKCAYFSYSNANYGKVLALYIVNENVGFCKEFANIAIPSLSTSGS